MKQNKEIEKELQRLDRKRAALAKEVQEQKERQEQYDRVMSEAGFSRPRAFLRSIMTTYGIQTVSLAGPRKRRTRKTPNGELQPVKKAAKKVARKAAKKATKKRPAVKKVAKKNTAKQANKKAAKKAAGPTKAEE
jgi:hypothetical protein